METHRQMEADKKIIKNKWKKISQTMSEYNFVFSAEQCRLKIKSLKDRYTRQKKKSNTSGEGAEETDTQLEDCFESQPDFKPVATIDTGAPEQVESPDDLMPMDEAGEPKPKKRRSVSDNLKDYLQTESERREAAAEKRHRERMDTTNQLIDVLKVIANK